LRPRERKDRIALAPRSPNISPMLASVLSAAVNGIEAFPVDVEINCGWEDTLILFYFVIESGGDWITNRSGKLDYEMCCDGGADL